MRYLCVAYLSLAVLLAGCATPRRNVNFESFRVVKTSPEFVEIELIGSNDGSKGEICLGVGVKSKDGSVRSDGVNYPVMPVGQNIQVTRRVMRPNGLGKHETDYLLVQAIQCGKEPLPGQRFDWHYVWPAISVIGKPEENEDLGTTNPWFALLSNLQEEDFSALDLLMDKWNDTRERDNNGVWKIDSFRNVLFSTTQSNNWQKNIALIKRWKHFNRKSPWAAIAEAYYWSSYAWHIRGCTYCKVVDPVAMKIFHERMQQAEKVLKDSKGFAANNPLWYETYLENAIDTKRDEKFIQGLFDEGIRKFPHFQQLYVVMSYQWTPLYGEKPDWKKVEELANYAVKLTSDTDGTSNYAWVYARINFQLRIEVDILQDSLLSWSTMRDSFKEMIERYPGALNLNDFAVFACRAGDKEAYLSVRPKIQGQIIPAEWPGNFPLDLCDHRFMQYS